MMADIFGFRNKIHNGKMEVAQRGTSFVSPVSGAYTLDRWFTTNTSTAAYTISQSTSVPSNEFQSSLSLVVTTADTSVAAGDVVRQIQRVEGYNIRDLLERTFTVSFYVRSSKTGIHCVAIRNSAGDRSYVVEYSITLANTWEKKSFTVQGGLPNSGTWNWTTGVGLTLAFDLMSGSTNQTTTTNAWVTGNFTGTANQVNVMDTVGNVFAITGVQMEIGNTASQFEHRPFGLEDFICKRYFERFFVTTAGGALPFSAGSVLCYSTVNAYASVAAKVNKRPGAVAPTTSAAGTFTLVYGAGTAATASAVSIANWSNESALLSLTIASGLTAGQSAILYASASSTAYVDFNSDL